VHWPLLDALSEGDRRRLVVQARRRRYGRNDVLFHEGDPGDTLYLVAQGHVAIRMSTPLGDVATVRIVRPGEFFGELAVVSPGPRNATAVALDQVEALVLDRGQLDSLRSDDEHATEILLAALVAEVRRLSDQLVEVMFVPVDKRLWRRILELSSIFGTEGEPASTLPMTQDLIAQTAGCVRPTANRVLRAGERAGLINMRRGAIDIVDFEGIRQRAR
jgi:CRP/FNR family transcriptional regulator, cyclic AMP receptor protein